MNEQRVYKTEEIHYLVFNNIKDIRKSFFDILELISKEINDRQNNILLNEDNNKSNSDQNKIQELWKENVKNIIKLKNDLSIFTNKNCNFNIIDYYINIYKTKINNNKLFQRNNFEALIYQNCFDFPYNKMVKDFLRFKINEFEKNAEKNKITQFYKQKNPEKKTINEYIYKFIKNNYKDRINERNVKVIENKPENIFFNCQTKPNEFIAKIAIEFFNFNIFIKIPFQKEFKMENFINKINIFVNFKYGETEINYLHKKKELKEFYKKNEHKIINFILIKKIQMLLENIVYSIIQKMIIIANELKIQIFEEDALIEFCQKFIYYIHDFDNIFKTKCGICQKIIKYSFQEKCFYPPYFKLYKERGNFISKNNNEENNFFYHEECLRRIELSFL